MRKSLKSFIFFSLLGFVVVGSASGHERAIPSSYEATCTFKQSTIQIDKFGGWRFLEAAWIRADLSDEVMPLPPLRSIRGCQPQTLFTSWKNREDRTVIRLNPLCRIETPRISDEWIESHADQPASAPAVLHGPRGEIEGRCQFSQVQFCQ